MAYNPASLRIGEATTAVDLTGIVKLVFPDGTVVDLGRGVAQINVGTTSATMSVDETPSGTIDGVNAVFTLAHTPVGGLFLYVSSIAKCWSGVTYNLVGATITFTAGNIPVTGDLISATYSY